MIDVKRGGLYSAENTVSDRPSEWFLDKPVKDGHYWWRSSKEDPEPEIVGFYGGNICAISGDCEYIEHTDFSGEFAGPLIPPP